MIQTAALSYIEKLETWTANNRTDFSVVGDVGHYTFEELELTYPGHFGQGFWIVTGEIKVTDGGWFGGCDIRLYNDVQDSVYGVCHGYSYDASWSSFSIVAGWASDISSTMTLMLEMWDAADDEEASTIELRNVRLAFVELNDAAGFAVLGRNWPEDGFHVKLMKWDYSYSGAQAIAPGASNTFISVTAANNISNTKDYVSFTHINGLDNFGGQDDSMKTYLKFNDTSVGSSTTDGITYMRPMGGWYPSYSWIDTHKGSNTVLLTASAHNDASSDVNMEFDIYGGWFTMLLERDSSDVYARMDIADAPISGNTSFVFDLALSPSSTRYLVLASGRQNVNTGFGTSKVTFGDETLGEYVIPSYYGDPSAGHFTTFANIVSSNTIMALRQNSSAVGSTGGPFSTLVIPLARDYVNSCGALPSDGGNAGSGTVSWTNTDNKNTYTTDTYTYMAPSTDAASNKFLQAKGLNFADVIPADAEIGYVWMYPTCRKTGSGAAVWDNVGMVVGGNAVGVSAAWVTPIETDWMYDGPSHELGVSTYWTLDNTPANGGTASRSGLWGYRPTAAQVRDPEFGVQMRCRATSGTPTVQVAYVVVYVYYRIPGETFNRSVTATAGNIGMTVDRDHDTERAASELALTETLTGAKAFDHTEALAGFTVGEPVGSKGIGQNKLHSVTGIPARLASALEAFKTTIGTITPSSKKETVPTSKATANVASTAASLSRGVGKRAGGIAFLLENRRFMVERDARSASATTTASGRKGVGKLRSATVAQAVSRLVGVGKSKLSSLTSTVSRTRQIARSFLITSTITVALNKVKNTAYYITESIVQAIVPTLQKAIVPTPKATGGYTMIPSLVFTFGVVIGGFITMGMTAAAGARQVGLNRLNPITSTLKRLVGIDRSDAVISTVTPSSQKAVVAEVNTASYSMSAAAVKAIGKVRARSLATAITARKAVSQAVDALTSTVTVAARKAVAALSALTSTVTLGGSKAISRITKRTVATIVTRQRAIARARARVMSTVAKSRRAIGSFLAAPLVATAILRKGISHRFARVSIGSVASLVTVVETLLKKIYFTFREVGFMSLVDGLTFKLGNSATTSHEQIYADLETIRLGVPEVIEAVLAEPDVIEATLTTEPEIIKVVL